MKSAEKHSLIGFLKERYRKAGKKRKGEIISEVCERLSSGFFSETTWETCFEVEKDAQTFLADMQARLARVH